MTGPRASRSSTRAPGSSAWTGHRTAPSWYSRGGRSAAQAIATPVSYLMNPDGSGLVTLVEHDRPPRPSPDWQPVVGAPPPGYRTPAGARRPRTCPWCPRSHNAPHRPPRTVPPLAFGSCGSPAPTSPRLTIGSPDANGAAARLVGSVRFDVKLGNSATEANEADVQIRVNVNGCALLPRRTRAAPAAARTRSRGATTRAACECGSACVLPIATTCRRRRGNLPATVSDTPVEINLPSCVGTPEDPVRRQRLLDHHRHLAPCSARPRNSARSCSSGRSG